MGALGLVARRKRQILTPQLPPSLKQHVLAISLREMLGDVHHWLILAVKSRSAIDVCCQIQRASAARE